MSNQNVRLAEGKKCLGSLPLKIVNYSFRDVLDVERAFAEIRVVDFAQGLGVTRGDFLKRPFHVTKIDLKFPQNFIDQSAVLDYEQVRIENRRVFCSDRFRNALLHLKDLHARSDKRRLEPPNFIRNPGGRDPVTHHLIQVIAHDMNPAEGDSG